MDRRYRMRWVGAVVAGLLLAAPGFAAEGAAAAADEPVKHSELGIQIHGDARPRMDMRFRSHQTSDQRPRVRLRLNATGQLLNGHGYWGVGLATNTADPVSRNTTLGGGDVNGSGGNIGLDFVYLGWRPGPELDLVAGKMKNPLWESGGIFDGDLTPEGGAVTWLPVRGSSGPVKNLAMTSAFWWVREFTSGKVGSDTYCWANQVRSDIGPVRTGLGLYYFTGLNALAPLPGPPLVPRGAAAMAQAGNQTISGVFPSDHMAVLSGRVSYPTNPNASVRVGAGIIQNMTNDGLSAQRTGYEGWIELPKLAGRSKLTLIYRDLNQNATFSPWSDSDLGEGTGYRAGVQASWTIPLGKNADFGLSYFHYDRNQPNAVPATGAMSTNRIQIDVTGKF
ncbi:MAG: putative porin [Armatimonadetes bacterium]|nr:putative porin [Armatimonadota bacterium]